jgi:hypothetical protein
MEGDICTNRSACAWDMAFGGQIIYGILIVCGKPSWKDTLGHGGKSQGIEEEKDII